MRVQSTSQVNEHKIKEPQAPVVFDNYFSSDFQQTDVMYPNLQFLDSSQSIQPQSQQPLLDFSLPPSNNNLQYNISASSHTPPVTTAVTPEQEKPYFVYTINRHSDTLTLLALRFGCTEESIKMLNNLLCDDLDLFDGNQLLIPKTDLDYVKKHLSETDLPVATEKQRRSMTQYFAKFNKISIDEARAYLEMNDWNSVAAKKELDEDVQWERQTGIKPRRFDDNEVELVSSGNSTNQTLHHRSAPRGANYSYQYQSVRQ